MSDVVAKLLSSNASRLKPTKRANFASFGEEVKSLRQSLGLSQDGFCKKFDIPIANLRNWEQDRTQPDSASLLLIRMIKVDPARVEELIAKASVQKSK